MSYEEQKDFYWFLNIYKLDADWTLFFFSKIMYPFTVTKRSTKRVKVEQANTRVCDETRIIQTLRYLVLQILHKMTRLFLLQPLVGILYLKKIGTFIRVS